MCSLAKILVQPFDDNYGFITKVVKCFFLKGGLNFLRCDSGPDFKDLSCYDLFFFFSTLLNVSSYYLVVMTFL